jgi:hypothetical protein
LDLCKPFDLNQQTFKTKPYRNFNSTLTVRKPGSSYPEHDR